MIQFFNVLVMSINLVSAPSFVAGTVTVETTSTAGLVSLLLIATALLNVHLQMVMLLWILPLQQLLMSSWKLPQTQWSMPGSMPMGMKMGMLVPGNLWTEYMVKATTTIWLSMDWSTMFRPTTILDPRLAPCLELCFHIIKIWHLIAIKINFEHTLNSFFISLQKDL